MYCPSPRLLAPDDGAEDAVEGEERAADVGERHPGLRRRTAGVAGDAHHAAHRLRDQVEAGPLRPGTGLAEAGDAGIDEARVVGAERRVVDAEARRDARPVVLDDDVGAGSELAEELDDRRGSSGSARPTRLLRFMLMKPRLSSPFSLKPIALRDWSPPSGGSTLITSAPMSPSSMQQKGPAMTWLRSRTRRPLSGRDDGSLPAAARRDRVPFGLAGFLGTRVNLACDFAIACGISRIETECSTPRSAPAAPRIRAISLQSRMDGNALPAHAHLRR